MSNSKYIEEEKRQFYSYESRKEHTNESSIRILQSSKTLLYSTVRHQILTNGGGKKITRNK